MEIDIGNYEVYMKEQKNNQEMCKGVVCYLLWLI